MTTAFSRALAALFGGSVRDQRALPRLHAAAGQPVGRHNRRRHPGARGAGGFEHGALEPRQLLAADLTASLNFGAQTVLPGQDISGVLTLRNIGDTFATDFTTRVVLSVDNVFGNGDDIAVEDFEENGPEQGLVAGEVLTLDGTLTLPGVIPAGNYFLLARIDVNNTVAEDNEGNNDAATASALITIAPPPEVSVGTLDNLASEHNQGGGLLDTGRFQLSRTGPLGGSLTVTYAISGTATAGTDYVTLSGTAVFAPGSATAVVTVTALQDFLIEANETVVLTIQAGTGYTVGTPSNATVSIVDDDPTENAAPDLAAGVSGTAGSFLPGETINATFGRSNFGNVAASTNFTTRFALSVDNVFGNEDDVFLADVLNTSTLNVGQIAATTQPLTIPANLTIPGNYFIVGRIDVFNQILESSELENSFATAAAEVTIAPPPNITIVATDDTASETPGNGATFTLTRDGPLGFGFSVNIMITGTATNGTDYMMVPATVTFASLSATATITISPTDDTTVEGDETVTIAVVAGGYYTPANPSSATATILDNEPIVSVAATTATTSETAGTPAGRFTLTRTGSTTSALTVDFVVSGTATNGTDYTTILSSATFGIGESSITIDVSAIDDTTVEPSETVVLTLSTGATYTVSPTSGTATVTIQDDEPSVSVAATTPTTSETAGTGAGVFTFTRVGPTTSAVTVTYTVTGTATAGTDYTTLTGTFTFGIGESTATVDVAAINDFVVEGSETVVVTIDPSASYSVLPGTGTATVTILDDEPTISVVATTNSTSETAGSDAGVFTFTRTGPTTDAFTINFTVGGTATAGDDYTAIVGMVTFAAGSATATVSVTAVDDALVENDETVLVTITADPSYSIDGAAGVATVTILDNEPTISIVASDANATEAAGNPGQFTLSRTGPTTSSFTVNVVVSGTATNGTDYNTIATTVTFAAGSATATIDVTTLDDAVVEGDETVVITLAADPSYRIAQGNGAATVTIQDNEVVVSVVAADPIASETAGDTGRFTFTRIGATNNALTANFVLSGTAAAGDFSGIGTTVVFPAGVSTVTLTLTAVNDTAAEPNETVVLTISNSVDYSVDPVLGAATITITDDEARPAPQADLSVTLTLPAAAASARPTQNISGAFTVRNAGAVTANNFVTRVVLSTNNIFGDADDVLVTEITNTVALARGQTRVSAFVVNVPDLAPGGYFILVKTDNANAVLETNEANNRPAVSRANLTIAQPPVFSIRATDAAAGETATGTPNGGRFTVTRTGALGLAQTVNYTVRGTATGGTDYTALSGTVSFAAGAATATIDVSVIDDLIGESAETVTVALGLGNGYTINLAQQNATVTIADNEPVVTIRASDAAAAETAQGVAANGGRFVVSRTGSTVGALVVNYTVAGTATSGADFAALSGTVTIPAGQTSANIDLSVLDDATGEPAETVIVTLAGSAAYGIGALNAATVTIADNEPIVSIRASDGAASEEGPDNARFTVTRTGATTQALVVSYTVTGSATNGTDYTLLSGTVTIPAGAASADVVISPTNDTTGEPTESVQLTLAAAAAYNINTAQSTAVATITDNEPTVTIVASGLAAEQNVVNGRFTVSRAGSTSAAITVNYIVTGTASAGNDFVALSGSVTIPAGQRSAVVTVTPVDDQLGEAAETVILTLADGTGYIVGATSNTAQITIADNEPTVTVRATDMQASETGPDGGRFLVSRTGPTTSAVTVTYSLGGTSTNGDDFTALTGSVVIPAGSSSAEILVTPINDLLGEGPETVVITLTGNSGYNPVNAATMQTITIADNEPIVSVTASDPQAAETGNNTGRFTFTRTGPTAQSLTVTYAVSGSATSGDDFEALTGTVTFAAGASTATVTLTALTDAVAEGDETVIVTITGNAGYFANPAQNAATVTIAADGPVVSIAVSDNRATEGANDPARFIVTRTGSTAQALTVNLSTSGTANGSDFSGIGSTVTIPAGASSVTIVMNAVDDQIGETDETVIVQVEPGAAYRVSTTALNATATIVDNEATVTIAARDGTATEGSTTDTARFTVTRAGGPTNVPITVNYAVSGLATNGVDYLTLSGTVTILAGRTTADILVTALADLSPEAAESVVLTLAGGTGYKVGTAASASASIVNVGRPDLTLTGLTFMGGDFSRTTPGQTLPITVNFQNLGPAAAGAFRIDLRLSLDAIFGNADDIVLGSIIVTGIDALATGSAVFTIDFDATAVPPVGSYFVGGRIDAGRTVTEVNEANNDGFSAMATIRIVA